LNGNCLVNVPQKKENQYTVSLGWTVALQGHLCTSFTLKMVHCKKKKSVKFT